MKWRLISQRDVFLFPFLFGQIRVKIFIENIFVSCYNYRCEPSPTSTICASTIVSQYTHYIPLRSRSSTTSYQELLEEIVASGNFSENCTNTITSLGCYITYPPCDSETGDAIPLCTENCDTEFASIQSCVAEVTVNNDLSNMMRMFNCSDVNSYLPDLF